LPSAPETHLCEIAGDFVPLLLFQSKTASMMFVGSILWAWKKVAFRAGGWELEGAQPLCGGAAVRGHGGIGEP